MSRTGAPRSLGAESKGALLALLAAGLVSAAPARARNAAGDDFNGSLGAARAGVSQAQADVARMLESGRGATADHVRAAIWYAAAAAQGDARAAAAMARLYAAGDGVPRNLAMAACWAVVAAARGVEIAPERIEAAQEAPPAELARVEPLLPVDGAMLERPVATGSDTRVQLVWAAPAEAGAVRYFVEVVRVGAPALQRVFAGYTELSAIDVAVDGSARDYAWRVTVVRPGYGIDGAHYRAGEWRRFAFTLSVP